MAKVLRLDYLSLPEVCLIFFALGMEVLDMKEAISHQLMMMRYQCVEGNESSNYSARICTMAEEMSLIRFVK
jgi:hypothetical protein